MGRPRKYATQAERQAAYRNRQVILSRQELDELEANFGRLRIAMEAAKNAGVEIARELYGGNAAACLHNLALWFERQAAQARNEYK